MTGMSSPSTALLEALAKPAFQTLCDRCVPELWNLAYNPRIPDRQLTVLLEWADDLGTADPSYAFCLEVLEEVFPALNTALLASYAFAGMPARDPSLHGHKVDLELTDLGGALLIERTRTCASLLAAAIHGPVGEALIRRANDELQQSMERISAMIARKR